MSVSDLRRSASSTESLSPELARPFSIIAFDWDRTAAEGTREEVQRLCKDLHRLLDFAVPILVTSSGDLHPLEQQLSSGIEGEHIRHLFLLPRRAAEVYGFDELAEAIPLWRQGATEEENRRLGEMAAQKGLPRLWITGEMDRTSVGLPGGPASLNATLSEVSRQGGISKQAILVIADGLTPPSGRTTTNPPATGPSAQLPLTVSITADPQESPSGAIHLGGGVGRFIDLLEEQIARHEQLRPSGLSPPTMASQELPVPLTDDPNWLLVEEGFNLAREHEVESLFTTANGYVGTRGSLAEVTSLSAPRTFVAGVFGVRTQAGAIPELVGAPDWTHLRIVVDGHPLAMEGGGVPLEHRRILDLRQGLLWREWRYRDPAGRITHLRFVRLCSLADRHVLAQSVLLTPENYSGSVQLERRFPETPGALPLARTASSADRFALVSKAQLSEFSAPGRGVTVALAAISRVHAQGSACSERDVRTADQPPLKVWDLDAELGKTYRADRLVTVYSSRDVVDPAEAAITHLEPVFAGGSLENVFQAHRQAWAQRWQASEVQVEGDPAAQRALRFATYHLISMANPEDDRVSIGARALTGDSYKGHVFWDTEIYMLPFYIYTHPPSARALLMYRYHTLPGAREKARVLGYRGALYAWESADDGHETTPASVVGPNGALVRVLCGEQEQHISADVAYGVWHYWQATGDLAFFLEAGAEILLDTARFWASRGTFGADGMFHIHHVIGPDEYHEGVDDNAYTNVMAQWNLEQGAAAARLLQQRWPDRWRELVDHLKILPDEPEAWLEIARRMYTGLREPATLIEQFRGYFGLEDIDLTQYEPRTAPMDVLLGRERTQQTQVVKQADVVMLLALLWDRFSPEVREAAFRYYEPRTGHGSSLSPAAHALVAARLGDVGLAARYFHQAAMIDLANNMGNAAGGVHAAALGGLWQAAVLGFGGLMLRADGLAFDPNLPEHWSRLRFPVNWRGRQLLVTAYREPRSLEVDMAGQNDMTLAVEDGPKTTLTPGRHYTLAWEGNRWGNWRQVQ
jgi:kojibiose phosphorylase